MIMSAVYLITRLCYSEMNDPVFNFGEFQAQNDGLPAIDAPTVDFLFALLVLGFILWNWNKLRPFSQLSIIAVAAAAVAGLKSPHDGCHSLVHHRLRRAGVHHRVADYLLCRPNSRHLPDEVERWVFPRYTPHHARRLVASVCP